MIKTIPASFTLNDLMAHLREEASLEGFYTSSEWAAHLGVTGARMNQLLKEAKAAGILQVSKAPRERLDGVISPSPVYRFDVEVEEAKGIDSDRGEVDGETAGGGA